MRDDFWFRTKMGHRIPWTSARRLRIPHLPPQQQGYHEKRYCRDHETLLFHSETKGIYFILQTFLIKSQSGIVQRLGYSAFNTFWVEAPERPGFGKRFTTAPQFETSF
jgi:hypothetical protein